MRVHIRYFAAVREAMGLAEEFVYTQCRTAGELRKELQARSAAAQEALAESRAIRMALNQVLCAADAPLTDNCELAFFPPVTGG